MAVAAANDVASGNPPARLSWLHMVNGRDGYALGGQNYPEYRLLRTRDGGRTWLDITPGRGTIHPSGPVNVSGSRLLFARTLHRHVFVVERSDDGGRSWRQSLPFRDPRGLGAGEPIAIDVKHLYLSVDEDAAAGSQGEALYRSGDGGRSWRFVSRTSVTGTPPGAVPFACDKDGFGFATARRGFAGGYCAGGPLFLFRSDDGGHSWKRQTLPGPRSCACDTSAPTFFDARRGLLAVEGFNENGSGKPIVRVYWTRDGGEHWRASSPTAARAQPAAIAGPGSVWLIAQRPGKLRSRFDLLYRTVDAGAHWQEQKLPFDGRYYRLDAVDANLAYALTYAPATNPITNLIVRTTDGGRHWQTIHATLAPRRAVAADASPATSPCRIDRIAVTPGPPWSEATEQHTVTVVLHNRGPACSLDGYPALSLYDAQGRRLPFPISHRGDQMLSGRRPQRFTLSGGASAYFAMNKNVCVTGSSATAATVHIGLPGGTGTKRLTLPRVRNAILLDYCGRSAPYARLTVSAMVPRLADAAAHH